MIRTTFTDPLDGSSYVWPYNPGFDAEQTAGKARSIERTSNSGNVGATKQQGDDGPYIIHWTFRVFTAAHELALWTWFVKCKSRTIYLADFEGAQYEGQIIELSRKRVGVLGGPGDTPQRGFYSEYDFRFEVWALRSGLLHDAGVTP